MERARHRRDRPGRRQSLPVRGDGDARRRPRRDHREYRHRRPVDGPLGGQEPRLSSRSSPIPPIMPRCSPSSTRNDGATSLDFRKRLAAKAFALTAAYDSMISPMVRLRRPGRALPDTLDSSSSKLKMPLRYGENPHQQAALYLPVGPARRRHRPGRAGPGQGAQLQQSQRRQCRARAGRRVPRRPADGGHRQARQSRAASPARDSLLEAWNAGARLRQRLGVRRDRRGQPPARRARPPRRSPRSSPKSSSRPTPTRPRRPSSPRKKNLRLLLTGELPDPARGGPDGCGDRRRPAGPGPRQRHAHARRAQGA